MTLQHHNLYTTTSTFTPTLTPTPTISPTVTATPTGTPSRLFEVGKDGFNFRNFSYTGADWEHFKKTFPGTNMELADGTRRKGPELYFNGTRYQNIGNGGNCAGFTAVSLIRYLDLAETVEQDLLSVANQAITLTHDYPEGQAGNVTIGESDVKDYIHLYQARQMSYQFGQWWGEHWQDTPIDTYQAIKEITSLGEPVAVSIRYTRKDNQGKDKQAGHRMTAYHTEENGNTGYIYVYDNNHPNNDTKRIEVDLVANKWQYNLFGSLIVSNNNALSYSPGSLNFPASLYPGSDFDRVGMPKAYADNTNDILLGVNGDAELLVMDDNGNKIGYENGQFTNTISGAVLLNEVGFNPDMPDYDGVEMLYLPEGSYNVNIQPITNIGSYTVTSFAGGSGIQLNNLTILTGSVDSLVLNNGVLDSRFTSNNDNDYCHYITREVSQTGSRSFETCLTTTTNSEVGFELDSSGDTLTIHNHSNDLVNTTTIIDEIGNNPSQNVVDNQIEGGQSVIVEQPNGGQLTIYLPLLLK